MLFGQIVGTLLLRSSPSGALTLRMRCACGLRKQRASSVSFPTPDPLLRRRPADSSRGALKHPGSVFRQARQGSICIGIPRHLTIRSSQPHVVASATCDALRLHASAAPPRGGLTQALGPMSDNNFESEYRTRMSSVTGRLTENHLDRMRSAAIGGSSVSTAIVLLLFQSEIDTITLKIALYAAIFAVPIWICAWQYVESYIFYGQHSYGHFNGPKGSGVAVLLAMTALAALVTSITSLIWHLDPVAAIAFLVLSLVAATLIFKHNNSVRRATESQEPYGP